MRSRFTPSLKSLRSFEAAARLQSLTLAAAELNVTVSAVAFQVRQVEEALGAPLLRRHGRGARATPEGRRLAEELAAGFAQIDRALESLRPSATAATRVTVSTLSSFASLWLLPRLAEFRAGWPDIEVRIATSAAHADLASGEVDCAIRCGGGEWPGVSSRPLFPQSLAPLCHRSHRAARVRELPSDRDLVVNTDRDGEWRAWFHACGLPREEPADGQPFRGRELVADAVYAGLGVGLMDVSLCSRDLGVGVLVQLGPSMDTGWTHCLVSTASSHPNEACETFMAWVLGQTEAGFERPREQSRQRR